MAAGKHFERCDQMYQVNDMVSYGVQGVCKIIEIARKTFGKSTNEYYVLKPLNHREATIYVPVSNEALVKKMRPVLSPEEIHQLIQTMPEAELLWIPSETVRKEKYKEIIAKGEPVALMQMIKALHAHQQEQEAKGKKLHMADLHFFEEAERLLYNEFAVVLELEPEQVLPFIIREIELTEAEKPKAAAS